MKKVLVTGANGFIGSLLVKELMSNGIEVIAAYHGGNDRIPAGVRAVEFTMEKFEDLNDRIPDRDIDVMYHLAWSGVSGALRGDYAMQLRNAKYTCDAVNVASKMGIKRFVGTGTLAQMDGLNYITENASTPNLVSCYGSAKTAAQFMSKAVANAAGIEHIWCYISNSYGIGDKSNNFINFACKVMLNGGRASFTTGEQNYDFVYITDTIRGLYLCAKNGQPNYSYYIGSGKARQLKEFIKIIRDTIDPGIPLFLGEVPYNGISLPIEKFSCEQIKNDTGYSAEVDFESGIKKTIEWLRETEK